MTNQHESARPPLELGETDADRLSNLALEYESRAPEVTELLLREIGRAKIVPDSERDPGVVAMMSTVEFADDASGAERTLQLVYPSEADIDEGRLSIMSLVGAGLIGLRSGQTIAWPDRGGHERALRIIEVTPPLATGA